MKVIEQNFSQIDGFKGSVKDTWKRPKRLLDLLNNDICKKEITPRTLWITQATINKKVGIRKVKNADFKACTRPNIELRI